VAQVETLFPWLDYLLRFKLIDALRSAEYVRNLCTKNGTALITDFEYVRYNRILVGKPEGKRPLGRPRRRWVDNIKMDL
jgi:hypothetical protein